MKKILVLICIFIACINCYGQCPPGQTLCGGTCVDINSNSNHCGACGSTCPPGQICVNGTCATSCPPGQTLCGGVCVDANSNSNNCGTCGNTCPPGQICVNGTCATPCPSGQILCGGICVDLSSNSNNCGTCGITCPPGQICVNGNCTLNTTNIIVPNNNTSDIFAYPNPVSENISIKSQTLIDSKVTVKFYDSKGTLIEINSELKKDFSDGILTIQLPNTLSKGIYYLNIESQTFNKIIKISKQ